MPNKLISNFKKKSIYYDFNKHSVEYFLKKITCDQILYQAEVCFLTQELRVNAPD